MLKKDTVNYEVLCKNMASDNVQVLSINDNDNSGFEAVARGIYKQIFFGPNKTRDPVRTNGQGGLREHEVEKFRTNAIELLIFCANFYIHVF